jgi:hypothetical protein
MSLLSNITATLGQKVWKQTLVVLTHANGGEGLLSFLCLNHEASRKLALPY